MRREAFWKYLSMLEMFEMEVCGEYFCSADLLTSLYAMAFADVRGPQLRVVCSSFASIEPPLRSFRNIRYPSLKFQHTTIYARHYRSGVFQAVVPENSVDIHVDVAFARCNYGLMVEASL
jgi:hypothetical protein